MRPLCALVLLFVAATAPGCRSAEEQAQEHRAAAERALAAGDVAGARDALRALRHREPADADELLAQCALLLRAGEAPQALWLLEAGVERFPARDDVKLELARTALVVGNPVRARAALDAVSSESAFHLQALLTRAHTELALGDLEAALDILADAEQRYPNAPEARGARIATLLRERRLDEAAAVIEAAREAVTEEEATALTLLSARIELAQGDVESATRRLSALHHQQPRDVAVLQALVRALLLADRADDALARVETAIERDPEQASLRAIAAQIHLQRGRFDEAEAALEAFAALSELPDAYAMLSQFHADRGDLDRAGAVLVDAVTRFPDELSPRLFLAENLIDRSDFAGARQRLGELAIRAPDDPHLAYLRARLDLAEGRAGAAAERLGAVVSELDQAHTQYWLGRALEATGDVESAERRYALALQRDGRHAAGARELMRLAEQRGQWSELARHAMVLIRRAPARDEGYAPAISALVRTGELEPAEALAREYARRFDDRPLPVALLAFALRARGALDEADERLAEGRERFGDDAELLAESGMLAAARGDPNEGVALLEAAVAAAPDRARHHASLAALLFARGQAARGAEEIDRALALDPDDLAPLELRARYRAAGGDLSGARSDCERYLDQRPRNAGVHFVHGVVLEQLDQHDAAIDAYRKAIDADARAFAARNNLALLLAATGDLPEALAVAQQAYGLAESNPDVIDTLGWLYLQSGYTDRSVALLEKAQGGGRPAARYHLALAYTEVGRTDEANALLAALAREHDASSALGADVRAALESLGAR